MPPTLPREVQQKLADKREWAALIGVCAECGEEVYANRDGILRTRLLSGSWHCLTKDIRPHVIGRYYLTGPGRWIRKWSGFHGLQLPEWAEFYRDNYMNGSGFFGSSSTEGARKATRNATNARD